MTRCQHENGVVLHERKSGVAEKYVRIVGLGYSAKDPFRDIVCLPS